MDSTEERTLYEILGVANDAPVEEIKRVYHDLARMYHPDSRFYDEIAEVAHNEEDEKKFRILTDAYNTLVDPDARAEYDRKLRDKAKSSAAQSSGPSRPQSQPDSKPNKNDQRTARPTAYTPPAELTARFRDQTAGSEGASKFLKDKWIREELQAIHEKETKKRMRVLALALIAMIFGIILLLLAL